MNPQEVTEELEHPGARTLLDSATLLRLAYNGSDGFPRVIPIGFYWNGNRIVACTAATAPKVKALSSRQKRRAEFEARSGRCTTGWRVSPSSRYGRRNTSLCAAHGRELREMGLEIVRT
jgi:nitroimidazol reductase NimA-like FMN-containing flavoprotein (pyridoxamine 5'-phosphate oxidase superfamily)